MNAPSPPPEALRSLPTLLAGDTVALISPSSHGGRNPPEYLGRAVEILRGWGLRVAEQDTPEPRHLYLAGTDAHRAERFQALYRDPGIKALFVTRGGYGSGRMLPWLDGDALAAAPAKPVVGFSDPTAVFAYLQRFAGVQVIHGPCLAAPSLLESPTRERELAALRQALFDPAPLPPVELEVLHASGAAGEVSGRLVGGCLSVLVTTLGTPWELDTRGAILFLEDIAEAPYRIDRMVTHLRAAGKFDQLRGLVFGYLADCDGDPPGMLGQTLRDLFAGAPFPVALGLPAGHGSPNLPLRLGARASLRLILAAGETLAATFTQT